MPQNPNTPTEMGYPKDQLEKCMERVYSNDYADFTFRFNTQESWFPKDISDYCIQIVNSDYGILHINSSLIPPISSVTYGYDAIPVLYTLLDTTSMDDAGITSVINQPYLNLAGEGIIIGFVDTGIDYQNPIFRKEDGSSKIVAIWDQSLADGVKPFDLAYGSEFTKKDIEAALKAQDPLSIVPSKDENGHGTFLAGIAAGRQDSENSFTGAAPQAEIAMVKLKPAKDYLRSFFEIPDTAVAYQVTDILLGVSYLTDLARSLNKPMVICFSLGSNAGDHTNQNILERYLNQVGSHIGYSVVIAGGNEGSRSHHYYGHITEQGHSEDVEVRVGNGEKGFVMELWTEPSEIFSVGFVSPTGEYIEPITPKLRRSEVVTFVLENTTINLSSGMLSVESSAPAVLMRFHDPTPGIWRIRVQSFITTTGIYHIWLPITGFISSDTVFLRPDPDTTLTSPASTSNALTVGAYDHINSGIYIYSSRGFTRDNLVKPDIVAPGVNVYGPGLNNTYTTMSGSSVAAAHAAGAAANLLSWSIVRGYEQGIGSNNIRAFLIRGATKTVGITYPSKEWGLGKLNLFHVFETLRLSV
ncbi:hypothetical protein FACS189418_2340 [Clostridia bacterium]|nr:hypothetical protein FACS189418_2340 [Clostridia bacterium]